MTYPDGFALNDNREVGDGHMEHARDGDTEELVTVLGLDDTLPPQRLALVVRNKPGLRALKSMKKKIQEKWNLLYLCWRLTRDNVLCHPAGHDGSLSNNICMASISGYFSFYLT